MICNGQARPSASFEQVAAVPVDLTVVAIIVVGVDVLAVTRFGPVVGLVDFVVPGSDDDLAAPAGHEPEPVRRASPGSPKPAATFSVNPFRSGQD
jgi:hypothetical protein